MSKKKGEGQDRLTEEVLENFLKMMEHLPEEAKEIVRQMATGMTPEWLHGLVLEKSTDYSDHTTHFIDLLDGRGTYPAASVPDMETYTQRFLAGKLKQPNFKTVRDHIREFEDNNGLPF